MKKKVAIALGLLMLFAATAVIAQATTRKMKSCPRCGRSYAVGTTHHCPNSTPPGRHNPRR